jgi:hypothetical protein
MNDDRAVVLLLLQKKADAAPALESGAPLQTIAGRMARAGASLS